MTTRLTLALCAALFAAPALQWLFA